MTLSFGLRGASGFLPARMGEKELAGVARAVAPAGRQSPVEALAAQQMKVAIRPTRFTWIGLGTR